MLICDQNILKRGRKSASVIKESTKQFPPFSACLFCVKTKLPRLAERKRLEDIFQINDKKTKQKQEN